MALFDRIGNWIQRKTTPKEERQILQPKVEPKQKWLQRVQNFFTPKVERQILEPKVEPRQNLLQRIFKRKPAPQPEAPQLRQQTEAEALRAAVEMLIQSEQHPGDATYEQARNAALVYINKSQKLAEKGDTQKGNRRIIAEKYLKKDISSPEGVEQRKRQKLDIFNANFGFDLTQDQADTVGQLMESDSFKKLMETYKERYDILIGMVGDQVELGVDPIRIEQMLDMWQQADIEPDFSEFANVAALSAEEFTSLREEIMLYNEENLTAEGYERQEDIQGIMGRYISW